MAQSITWLGNTYTDVPSITLPKTGGGTALFADPTVVTATASDVASGKYFINSSGTLTEGTATGGGAIVVTEEPDSNGGVIKNISAVDISNDTVDSAHLLYGYTAHDSTGTAITGSYVPPSVDDTFTLEYQVDLTQDDPFTFDSTFEEIKAAVQAGKVFEYTSYDDPVIGGFFGSCYITNQTYQGHYYTEAVRFYLDGTDGKTYIVWYGYVGGVISEDYEVYQMEVPTATLTADDSGDWNVVEIATLTIPGGTAGTPSATKGTVSNHSVSVTPSVTNQSGWINGGTKTGTAVTVSASELVSGTYNVNSSGTKDVTNYASASVPSGTVTAPSTITGTSATVSTGTNTLTLTKTVSVTPSVTTAGYVSSGTAGNSSVSLTASVTTQAAQTIHPSTSDQTIASGRYLTGTQTIKAVTTTNLSASNILSGVTIKVGDSSDDDCVASVAGSVTFQTYYTGSSAPSSSLGNNGDIYLQTS